MTTSRSRVPSAPGLPAWYDADGGWLAPGNPPMHGPGKGANAGDPVTPRPRSVPVMAGIDPVTGSIQMSVEGAPIQGLGAPALRNFVGGQKIRGRSDYQNSGINATSWYKVEAEAPFSAVRVWVVQDQLAGNQPRFQAAVAPTEHGGGADVAQMYSPIRAGNARRALADGADPNGFRLVTWDGADFVEPAWAPGTNQATLVPSDWIPCSALPRVDSANGRPCLVAVVAQTVANGTCTVGLSTRKNDNIQNMRGAAYFREWYATRTNSVDGVANLALVPADTSQIGNTEHAVFFEFSYTRPCRNVLLIGDSTHQGANATNAFDNFARMAMMEVSTPDAPVGLINLGASSATQYQFRNYLDQMLEKNDGVTDVVFQGFTGNGFTTMGGVDMRNAERFIAEQMEYLHRMAQAGLRVFMTTGFVYNYNATQDLVRQRIVQWVREACANGLAILVDTELLTTDYSTGTGRFKAAYFQSDQIHPNALGHRHCADLLKTIWYANTR